MSLLSWTGSQLLLPLVSPPPKGGLHASTSFAKAFPSTPSPFHAHGQLPIRSPENIRGRDEIQQSGPTVCHVFASSLVRGGRVVAVAVGGGAGDVAAVAVVAVGDVRDALALRVAAGLALGHAVGATE